MHRFFAEPGQIGEKEIVITGADVNHIRNVLRMRADEEVLIADGQGAEYRCKLTDLGENEVRAQILWKLDGNAELASAITLFQGLPKSDKMDLIAEALEYHLGERGQAVRPGCDPRGQRRHVLWEGPGGGKEAGRASDPL